MDKQRKLVLILFIVVVIALGLAVYFGSTIDSARKKISNNNTNKVVDLGYVLENTEESFIVKNTHGNYEITLPSDWQQAESLNSGLMTFYSADIEIQDVGTELTEGMKLDIITEPADQGLTIVENMTDFFSQVENYEEIEVNGVPAVVTESGNLVYSKATYIFDNIEGLMFIVAGYGDGGEEFLAQYDEIVNSFVLTNK